MPSQDYPARLEEVLDAIAEALVNPDGGTGWSATQLYIFNKEFGLAGCPPLLAFGVSMVAPVIWTFGNDEQKAKYLPDILNFNTWWCQGYSEPGSGSDLASLKTKAVLENDHYIVNGFLHEDKDGRLLDVATMDVFAKTESEALDKASKLVEKKYYRVASVVTHDDEKCSVKGHN